MSIVLPTTPGPAGVTVRRVEYGGWQEPSLGGPLSYIDRLGSRYAADFVLPPMKYTDAMVWIARLQDGLKEGVLMEFPQPGLTLTGYGTGTISGSGSNVTIAGAGGALLEGQFFSVVQSGRRYLHSATSTGTTISITPMLRVVLSGATVEVGNPKIEGVLLGNELSWNVNTARHAGIAFTVVESK